MLPPLVLRREPRQPRRCRPVRFLLLRHGRDPGHEIIKPLDTGGTEATQPGLIDMRLPLAEQPGRGDIGGARRLPSFDRRLDPGARRGVPGEADRPASLATRRAL